jgi:hypothetical protein
LIQLLITAAVIFALLWFGLPFGASWLATNALHAAGFTGTETKVEVSANLPPRILFGHADTIRLTSSQVYVGDLHAATIDLTLGDVNLIDRSVGTVSGTLTGVSVPAINGDPATIDTATLDGSGTSAKTTLSISYAEVQSLAVSQLKAQAGITGTVKLAAPDAVTVTIHGQSAPGHLVVKDGALIMVPVSDSLPTVTLIEAGGGNPFKLQSVAVGAKTVTLVGTIDLQTLLGL